MSCLLHIYSSYLYKYKYLYAWVGLHASCRGEWYKMIGVLLAHNLEHVHGAFGSMWSMEEKPGTIHQPPKFGQRFGVSLNR